MQNLFEFGTNNKDLVLHLLNYLKEDQYSGLCDWTVYGDYEANSGFCEWFHEQEPFASIDSITPVERAILKVNHQQLKGWELYRSTPNKIDVSLPQGQLRRWWCYNLAIAASQHPEFE